MTKGEAIAVALIVLGILVMTSGIVLLYLRGLL